MAKSRRKKQRNMQRKTELDASFNFDLARDIHDAYDNGDETKFRELCNRFQKTGGEVVIDDVGNLRIFSAWQSFN